MKTSYAATIALALVTLAAGQVMAADSGDVVESTSGLTLREINPSRYATANAAPAKTNEQVRAELAQAQANRSAGDVVEPTTGLTLREISSATHVVAQAKTRAQVRTEFVQARHNADGGDVKEPITGMTMREINPSRYAKTNS